MRLSWDGVASPRLLLMDSCVHRRESPGRTCTKSTSYSEDRGASVSSFFSKRKYFVELLGSRACGARLIPAPKRRGRKKIMGIREKKEPLVVLVFPENQ